MAASKTKSKSKINALGALADAGRDLHARQPRWPNPDRLARVGLVEVLMSQRRLPRTSGDVDIYEALERQGLVERQGGKLAFVATALGRSIPLSAFSAQDRQSASEGIEDVGYARGSKHARLAARPKHSSARAGRASGLRGPKQPTLHMAAYIERVPRAGYREAEVMSDESVRARTQAPPEWVEMYGVSRVRMAYRALIGGDGAVEIWQGRLVQYQPRYAYSTVAYDRARGVVAGMVAFFETSVGGEEGDIIPGGPCDRALKQLSARHGIEPGRAIVVGSAKVSPDYRNRGIGVMLYVAGAAVARKEYRSAIVADACTAEGGTSDMARRVWSSKRFIEMVETNGLMGVFKA